MENNGWIKLHRTLLKWEWADNPNTGWLFVHCLLSANHADKKWHGITVKKGTFITSHTHLAKKAGLSVMQVRTSLKRLKVTGELTVKTTNRYSLVSVCNWIEYQDDNRQPNRQVTGKQQTDNKQITTNKNDKNEEKEKNDKNTIQDFDKFISFWNKVFGREFKAIPSLLPYFIHWRQSYSLNEMGVAIKNAKSDKFWSDKITPTIFLRKKNPQGEPTDLIGTLINKERKLFEVKGGVSHEG